MIEIPHLAWDLMDGKNIGAHIDGLDYDIDYNEAFSWLVLNDYLVEVNMSMFKVVKLLDVTNP